MIRTIFLYCIYLKYKIKYFGKVKFNGFAIIFKFKECKIEIGKSTTINSSFSSNLLGMYQKTIIICRHGGRIKIGENVGISGVTIYAMKKIQIGDYCMIGANCKLIDNDFHPLDLKKRIQNRSEDIKKRDIIIGDNSFIGMNSIILKGTKLGSNCIVGAGSVVSGAFPNNVIIAGNPAKIIKSI